MLAKSYTDPEFDAAGNLLTSTDAKGQVTTYTYDALNRVTSIAYSTDTGLNVTFGYDAGTNGKGRLTSIADSSGTMQYSYDEHGRMLSETRTINAVAYVTSYQYDSAGRLNRVTYPGGRQVDYTFDSLGRIAGITTTKGTSVQTVVSNVQYHPFGGAKAFTFGNGTTYTRTIDQDGRIAAFTEGNLTRVVAYDAASRIDSISEQGNAANTKTYGYDTVDRLTSYIAPSETQSFTYDLVGNRLTQTIGANTYNYTYPPTSNRLDATTGPVARTFVHDANGSITGDGANSFTYDGRGRLVSVTTAQGVTQYTLNSLGQRVTKSGPNGSTVFHYDSEGRLIAESGPTGDIQKEYVYLGTIPVAVLVPGGNEPQETIVDNGATGFTVTGEWPASTIVGGFEGVNYQVHTANGDPPGGIVVDNTDAGFSVTGEWAASTVVTGFLGSNYQVHAANGDAPGGTTVDNTDAGAAASGSWGASTTTAGFLGTNYQAHAAGTGTDTFTWTAPVASAGSYKVYARWTSHTNRASNAKYTINHASGSTVVTVNQQAGGGQFNLLGTFDFAPGTATITLSDDADGYVIADAVKIVDVNAAPNTATWTVSVPQTKNYKVYARWTEHPNRATDAKYTVNHAAGATQVTVNQQANMGQWNLLGTFALDAGATTVTLTDEANGYVIADAVKVVEADAAPNTATWAMPAGEYEVYARWTSHPNRASDAKYTVTHTGGSTVLTVNQQLNSGQWNLLGTFTFGAGSDIRLTDEANGYVIADAIRLVPTAGQGAGPAGIFYVFADQIDTPRAVADETNEVVWRWDSDPFGSTAASEDPDGDQQLFTFNLRFPGQYYDKETNLHYNYFRDYEPSVGRYWQSDPLGILATEQRTAPATLNVSYAYVDSDPLHNVDPNGQAGIAPAAAAALALYGCYKAYNFIRAVYATTEENEAFEDQAKQCLAKKTTKDCPLPEKQKTVMDKVMNATQSGQGVVNFINGRRGR